MTTKLVSTLAAFAVTAFVATPAAAQSGAKALFYSPSGATLQSNAPGPGMTQGMPAPPTSTLGTGYPSTPGIPAVAAPPTLPSGPASASSPATGQDPAKLAEELRALTSSMSATTPPPAAPGAPATPGVPTPGSTPSPSDSAAGALPPLPPLPTLASDGTKSLAAPTHMGVKYWVELVDASGRARQITTEQVFRAGDRIKLHVVTNRDGYLTLVNVGSTGQTHVLFPSASAPAGNFVTAGADYVVPAHGYLRFDANPGQETLILMFSPAPMAPPTTAAAAMTMTRGAKDLIQEVDASSPQPATYAVAPVGQDTNQATIAIQIKLNHQ